MPELRDLLEAAAATITPSPAASFADVERRLVRRRRRRGGLLAAVVLLAGAGAGVAIRPGGDGGSSFGREEPCVPHTELNARDTFLAVPRSGIQHVVIQVGSTITVGWLTCAETGDLEVSDDDPKRLHLATPGTGMPVATHAVSSAQYEAFHTGSVTLSGRGSQGSTGALQISIVPFVEPAGPSSPSPYPGELANQGLPIFCLTPDGVGRRRRVTRLMSIGDATIAPAPGRSSRLTAADVLRRFRTGSGTKGTGGHPQAVFGLYTDRYSTPFPQDRPLWVVVVCDAPYLPRFGGGLGPAPAPGTSPSPGGQVHGLVVVPYDESGDPLGMSITGYADAALRAELLFEVPFERNDRDASAGRQIGLSYRSDDSCSTFDHIAVAEPAGSTVYVQIWLRLLGTNRSCTAATDAHDVVAGLRAPLGDRALVRGVPPR